MRELKRAASARGNLSPEKVRLPAWATDRRPDRFTLLLAAAAATAAGLVLLRVDRDGNLLWEMEHWFEEKRRWFDGLFLSATSGEPAVRSVFDVYIGENTVSYLKSPCGAADVQAQFFLHVVPEDVEDLPADRRQYGFDNLDFRYDRFAALAFGGMCIAKRPLPDYPIARIRTGQFTANDGEIRQAEFAVGAVEGAPSPYTAVP